MGSESEVEELISCLETQITEIETIACIFTEEEYSPCDEETVDKMRDLCLKFQESSSVIHSMTTSGLLKDIFDLKCLSFDLKIPISCEHLETSCSDRNSLSILLNINFLLPHNYPKELPKVYISSDQLSRTDQARLNEVLNEYIEKLEPGNQMVYDIVDWIRENTGQNIVQHRERSSDKLMISTQQGFNDNIQQYATMWLYMHHIYNKEKRKDIINWAKELELTGFSLPGKPGVVHVEGSEKNVDDYFARLKRLSWKRMSCVQKESFKTISRKFEDFQELNFDAHGARDYHMDMGKFHVFLKEHGLGSMFTVLFGLKDN